MHLRKSLLVNPSLLALMAFALQAQQPQPVQPSRDHDPNAMDSTTTEPTSPAPAMTPEQVALIDRYLTPVRAQPIGKIDTRDAAAGEGIALQITADATLANGTELPRGTRLTGRVLRAQPFQKNASAAVLSIEIDRAVLHDGTTVPVRCVLRALTPAPGLKPNLPGASQRGSRPSRGGGSMGGGLSPLNDPGANFPIGGQTGGGIGDGGIGADSTGGMVGTNSPLGGANSPLGGPDSPIGDTYPGTTTRNNIPGAGTQSPGIGGDPGIGGSSTTIGDRARNALGTTTPIADQPVRPVTQAGVDLHDAPRRTGLPGVMLSGASVAGVSGTLSAFDANIVLDSNTQLTLGVISR